MASMHFEGPELSNSKLSVIGAGSVGSSIAYASLIRGSASEIALFDIDEKKVLAEVDDLSHGTQFTRTSIVQGGSDVAVTKDSTVVIITAGARQQPGQTRLDLAGVNVNIMKKLIPALQEQSPNAIFVLVTNPCDVLTVVAQKISGLPISRVFSTGTMLDTSRLRWGIARKANLAQSNVHAQIMGEHGDSEFPVWSTARIGSIPIRDWVDHNGQKVFTEDVLAALAEDAVHAAYSIIEGKGATNYAIGLAGARLAEALHSSTRRILPLSSVLTNYRGVSDVALSVPSIVSNKGIERVLEVPMDAQEITMLQRSAATMRKTLDALGF